VMAQTTAQSTERRQTTFSWNRCYDLSYLPVKDPLFAITRTGQIVLI
jgi:hypothetical protein